MKSENENEKIVTRIFISEDGNLLVSDLWEDILVAFFHREGDEIVF